MRKIFEQLMATFRQFLKQRDYLLLLVPCGDSDVALLLKALRDLDRAVAICPSYAEAYAWRAEVKKSLRDYSGALADRKSVV